MVSRIDYLSTGLPHLDKLFKGLIPGDNIVWHTDSVETYSRLSTPYWQQALQAGQQVSYLRFSSHPPLATAQPGLEVISLEPQHGFEAFVNAIHEVIAQNGNGGYYLFDCLSDLVQSWHSDEMLGNFFKLTCPYLLDVEAIAYFALQKNGHSKNALQPILSTTQLFTDVYRIDGQVYLHPIKVQHRSSPTMHMLHRWDGDTFTPEGSSGLNSQVFTSVPWKGEPSASRVFDRWTQVFLKAEYLLSDTDPPNPARVASLKRDLLKMVFARSPRILEMAQRYLSLSDLTAIGRRMIGTGLIGGKSAGMLLATAIVRRETETRDIPLEPLDSFFIGSDVFYSYLIRNGCWWARQQKDMDSLLHNARHARRIILTGEFTPGIMEKLHAMLDYFGQSPILVRSSSLLEDSFGNAFSGKYESVFCPNQGSRAKCMDNLLAAIRTVYASAMSEEALHYRHHCGLLEQDEQMALLVQRVSGNFSSSYFFPLLAGVGYSFNPYAWDKDIDAESGLLRLVTGLGTRAVGRADDDYTRIVALSAPMKRPGESGRDARRYSQTWADAIDIDANRVVRVQCDQLLKDAPPLWRQPVLTDETVSIRDDQTMKISTVTFDALLNNTTFPERLRRILKTLEIAYDCPVDIEFTANITGPKTVQIGLVQCRPFQVKRSTRTLDHAPVPLTGPPVLKSDGPIIGLDRELKIDRIVFIDPDIYGQLPTRQRYAVANVVGQVMNTPDMQTTTNVLVGPGRFGTSMPELGVPVTFADIHHAQVICELVMMHEGLIPDASLGSHFFNDLVEADILYMGVFPNNDDTVIDWSYLRNAPQVSWIDPHAQTPANVVRVIDSSGDDNPLHLLANSQTQRALCAFRRPFSTGLPTDKQ